jgi:hypothetical protein
MADKATTGVEGLVQAYNQTISNSIAAVDAGMEQASATVKLMSDAVQKERTEYGKVWDQAGSHARKRNENITSIFPTVFQGMAASPAAGMPGFIPGFSPEAKESMNKIIESEMAFYEVWTKSWMEYLAQMEARRSAASQALLESNSKAIASSHEAMKSAVKYGEAIIDWSLEAAKAPKS